MVDGDLYALVISSISYALVQAPFVYALQCLTGRVNNNTLIQVHTLALPGNDRFNIKRVFYLITSLLLLD